MEKRCAYFGCMHPMFTPKHHSQKYCSEECAKRGNRRVPSRMAANKANKFSFVTPEMNKKAAQNRRKKNYAKGAKAKLPPWMFS